MFCPRCGLEQPMAHRFCVACGRPLPSELLRPPRAKIARWFASLPVRPNDPPGAALRVTRYFDEVEFQTLEGSVRVPSRHVRFSIWHDGEARCSISISDDEAEDLVDFLARTLAAGGRMSQPTMG